MLSIKFIINNEFSTKITKFYSKNKEKSTGLLWTCSKYYLLNNQLFLFNLLFNQTQMHLRSESRAKTFPFKQ